jgi:hypothetical protein
MLMVSLHHRFAAAHNLRLKSSHRLISSMDSRARQVKVSDIESEFPRPRFAGLVAAVQFGMTGLCCLRKSQTPR